MVSSLAERLERALPDHVEVSRRKFGRGITIVASLNPETYRLELRGKKASSFIDHVVRGVCVRSEELDFDNWLTRFAAALDQEARKNTTLRLSLEEAL